MKVVGEKRSPYGMETRKGCRRRWWSLLVVRMIEERPETELQVTRGTKVSYVLLHATAPMIDFFLQRARSRFKSLLYLWQTSHVITTTQRAVMRGVTRSVAATCARRLGNNNINDNHIHIHNNNNNHHLCGLRRRDQTRPDQSMQP